MTTAEFMVLMKQKRQIERRVHRYLNVNQKQREAIHSAFAVVWAVRLIILYATGFFPLKWTGFGPVNNTLLVWAVLCFALVHACGTWCNGHWRWSPMLRFAGLFGMTWAFAVLTWASPWWHGDDAAPLYGFVTVYLLFTMAGIAPDLCDACRKDREDAG